MNDQTSSNPRAVAEARRLAADIASGRPLVEAPSYDPIVVAREVFYQLIDRRVSAIPFDEAWRWLIQSACAPEHEGPVVGAISESEFRHFVAGSIHLHNAKALQAAVEKELQASHIMRGAFSLDVTRRFALEEGTPAYVDVPAGVLRLALSKKGG